ncbi:MAG: glycoside hydrolase family 3 protein, partial [Clostridium sp.]
MKLKKLLSLGLASLMVIGLLSSNGVVAKAESENKKASEIVSKMTVEEKVGQVLMPSFSKWLNYDITSTIPYQLEEFIKKYKFGGVILFGANFNSVNGATTLAYNYHNINPEIPMLLAVDQEGGGVTRIQGSTYMNGNMALGAVNDLGLTEKTGEIIGKETSAIGVDITFAPVLDVYVNPTNTVIGTRSFGDNADLVAKHGAAYIKGVQSNGASAAAKHFPGNGDSITDTHAELNINDNDRKKLKEVDLKPFQEAINGGVDMIMTSHSAYPALDDSKNYSNYQKQDVYKA